MNLEYGKTPSIKKVKLIHTNNKKNSSLSYIFRSIEPSNKLQTSWDKGKRFQMSKSQGFKRQLSNSLIYPYLNSTFKSSIFSRKELAHKLLYDDIIKLKTKLNKLQLELIVTKSENRKKEEQLKKAEQILEYAKSKEKEKIHVENLKRENQIIILKENYQNLQDEKKKLCENNIEIEKDIKTTNIKEIELRNYNNLIILKDKINQYQNILMNNRERGKELLLYKNKKITFFNNHFYLEDILNKIDKKNRKINIMKNKLQKLKDNFNKMDEDKKRIIRYNDSLEKLNQKLLIDKKKRENFILKKPDIKLKISEYEEKIKDLEDEEKNMDKKIEMNENNNKKLKEPKITYHKIYIETNPEDKIEQKVRLYESLIKESKNRQNEFIELFKYYNDYIQQKNNYEIINNEVNFLEEKNKNSYINNSNDNNKEEKLKTNEKDKKEIKQKKFNDFIFLLNMMIYIKKVEKHKISNILLNFKTQNLFLGNLDDKNTYLLNLSKEILALINDKNENDIELLKKFFIYLFEEKYQNNKESFLDNIINDLIQDVSYKENKEQNLIEKIKKNYKNNLDTIIEKIKKTNQKIITYKKIKKIFKDEKLYIKKNNEKLELFKFFVYILKRDCCSNENTISIYDFYTEDILNLFKNLYENNNKINGEENLNNIEIDKKEEMSLTREQYNKIIDSFISQIKKVLNDKKINIKKFIGESNIKYIKKGENEIPCLNIHYFFDLLKKNELKFDEDNLFINCIFSHYKIDENSEDINIVLLENDLK